MTKHTPGPWTVTPHPHLPIARVHRGPHDPGGVPICAVNLRSLAALSESGDSEDDANARLIAAAPALLKVARVAAENAAIVTDLLLTPSAATPEEMVNVITSLGKLARAAITKAEEG